MTLHIEWKREDDEGNEYTTNIPAKYDVCSKCEGHGTHLNESMRTHAYTQEEFQQEFSEEDAKEYFTRGGIYDVTCSECEGKRVVLVPDWNSSSWDAETKKQYMKSLRSDAEQRRLEQSEERGLRMMAGDY